MNQHFDAVVIGAGQAGPPLAEKLSGAGKRVAVIERKLVGGTCVNTGCIPTKAMVASAYVAHMSRRAHEYGVRQAGDALVDMQQVWQRTQGISGTARNGVDHWLRNMSHVTLLEGHARFESATALRLGDNLIEAESFFINVGGRAAVPDLSGIDAVPFLTNTGMMELRDLPEHLIIIGGSYIGLEFGQMFRRFGSKVTIVERSARLLPHEDEDISTSILALLQDEGITVHLGAECIALEGVAGAVRVKAQGNRVCCLPSVAGPTRTTLAWTRRASLSTRMVTSRSTSTAGPMCPAYGPWAIAMGGVLLPIPPITISKSSPRMCSIEASGAFRTASLPTACLPILRWPGSV
jgi:pyruvate/2-oxoglutarate dehydrogenase complex dihydrolipoamide dehydrogenase (E3) component